jgi:hypothetical protein
MTAQREKVVLDLNRPVTLALKYQHGKMLPDNGYGASVMYSTQDDRVLFVDPDTSLRISKLDLAAGESFCISKTKNGRAPARLNVWLSPASEQRRASGGTPEPPSGRELAARQVAAAPPDDTPARTKPPKLPVRCYADRSGVAEQMEGTIANLAEGRPAAAPRPSPVPPAIAARLDTHPPMPPTGLPPRNGSTPIKATYGAAMAEFLLIAGRATRAAEVTLGAEGGSVRFDSRDVAALATTMMIAAERAGWITWKPGETA